MRKQKAPKLPGFELWWEPIDDRAFALFACRRWEQGPQLTVWRIITADEGPGWNTGLRGRGAAMLMEAEERVHIRWYVWAQKGIIRSVNEYGVRDFSELVQMTAWTDIVQRPKKDRENAGLAGNRRP